MSSNICYEKDNNSKDNINQSDVCYDIQGKRQTFRNSRVSKGREEQQYTKYVTGRDNPGDYYNPPRIDADDSDGQYFNVRSKYNPKSPKSTSSTRKNEPRASPRPPSYQEVKKGKVCEPDYRVTDGREMKKLPPHCFQRPPARKYPPCTKKTEWQNAKYCKDDCGSGIVPLRYNYNVSKRVWCRTPLTTYQASHGELARKILCGEKELKRLINDGPPCNICEYIFPPCRGYYRPYDCIRPCEDESDNLVFRDGRSRLRDKVERYWESCFTGTAKQDVNTFAPQNMALALKYRRKAFGGTGAPCW